MTDLIEISLLCAALWYTFSTNKLLKELIEDPNDDSQ